MLSKVSFIYFYDLKILCCSLQNRIYIYHLLQHKHSHDHVCKLLPSIGFECCLVVIKKYMHLAYIKRVGASCLHTHASEDPASIKYES